MIADWWEKTNKTEQYTKILRNGHQQVSSAPSITKWTFWHFFFRQYLYSILSRQVSIFALQLLQKLWYCISVMADLLDTQTRCCIHTKNTIYDHSTSTRFDRCVLKINNIVLKYFENMLIILRNIQNNCLTKVVDFKIPAVVRICQRGLIHGW